MSVELSLPFLEIRLDQGATFSPDGVYRYLLWRSWDPSIKRACFLMLNPSTADEHRNDPTVERCERRARAWGWGGLVVVNLFALRSTDPAELYRHPDPVGPKNDEAIAKACQSAGVVICAWGAHGKLHGRSRAVMDLLEGHGLRLSVLRVNQDGQPAHPLYLPYSLQLQPWPSSPSRVAGDQTGVFR